MTEEEGQQKCTNMRPIHIRICHDDNFMISDFVDIHISIANTCANCCDKRANLCGRQHLIQSCPFHIQNFTSQRQNRLIGSVSALFS